VVEVWRDTKASSARRWATCSRPGTRSAGASPLRDNPACADAEHAAAGRRRPRPAPAPELRPGRGRGRALHVASGAKPKLAILREQGVNSHVEMSRAMALAGFETFDVHMSDLQAGRARLDQFQGFVACGGFSYGDTLGAGEGWARSILFNPALAEQFAAFFAARQLRAGRVQRLPDDGRAGPMIPGAEAWPRFTRNRSEQFEARLSLVEVLDSPSLFFAGMAGSRMPIAVAHGEGLPTSRSAATRPGAARDALRRPPRPADRGLPGQPQRQPRRPDRGDHRRRPLHGADAAPRAGVPQRADELEPGCACDARTFVGAGQPLAAHVPQRAL
jgi:phosphoribosylformylglycinamidine synthase